MHNGSWLLGSIRYPCKKWNKISDKAEKEGKSWEKPSPKKKDEKARCMDGWSNEDPPIMTYIKYINRELGEG